jgi:hypothetical protein
MTPAEKAIELFSKYSYLSENHVPTLGVKVAKQCALIAVDEIISNMIFWKSDSEIGLEINKREYWEEVKKEIEKL